MIDFSSTLDLQSAIRALPECVDAVDARRHLQAAIEATAFVDGGGWQSLPATRQRVMDAVNSPKVLGFDEVFLFGDNPKYCDGSPQKNALVALLGELYGDSAASETADKVRAEARHELFKDLTDPANWWKAAKPWLVALAIGIGAIVALQLWQRRSA